MGVRGLIAIFGKIFDITLKVLILGVVVVVLVLLFKMKEERLKSSQDVCEAQNRSWETKLRSCEDTCAARVKSLESNMQVYKDSAEVQARAYETKLLSAKESQESQGNTFTVKSQQLVSQIKALEEKLKEKESLTSILNNKIDEADKRYAQLTAKVKSIADIISRDSAFANFQQLNRALNDVLPGYVLDTAASNTAAFEVVQKGSVEKQIQFYESQVKKEKEKIKLLEKQLLELKNSAERIQNN